MSARIVAVGQFARDLVLVVDGIPPAGGTAQVRTRREMLGGKGANQAVAAAQLGLDAALIAVVGEDEIADRLLDQASRDGIDVSRVVRRAGAQTALITEVLEPGGRWRYLQYLPEVMLLTEADVNAAADRLRAAQAVLIQLQQPAAAAVRAARIAHDAGALVVLDGAPDDDARRNALLGMADIVRADAQETELLTGLRADSPDRLRPAVAALLDAGVTLVAFALHDNSNLFAWPGGDLLVPPGGGEVVDTTGAGDALTAALAAAVLLGAEPTEAARFAVRAAAATVNHPGGRPDLEREGLPQQLANLGAQQHQATAAVTASGSKGEPR